VAQGGSVQPIDKPRAQLSKAKSYIEQMENSNSLQNYEDNWKEFLHNLERSWNKLTSHLKRSPKYQGWTDRGKAEKLRRQDPLLSYLVNARGAEEHSVADITSNEAGGIGINPAVGNSLHIKKMVMNNGQLTIDSDQALKIEFIPGKMILLPVENRGRIYQLPIEHLGQKIDYKNPVEIAKLGYDFYLNYFNKAEKHFVK
jgi:hypothetical protein